MHLKMFDALYEALCAEKKTVHLRRQRDTTQDGLTDQRDSSFQAFSDWKRGCSMPDRLLAFRPIRDMLY